MSARYIIGDVFDALASLPDNSVDLVFSSPPFLALRSYLPADHPNKAKEIGSEATPADFLDTLLDVVEACDRVLAPHGSLCFELGDTYAGSGGAGGDYTNENGLREGQPVFRQTHSEAWPLPKSLALLPTLFAASLAYGRNLLRPERLLRGTDPCRHCDGVGRATTAGLGPFRCANCDGSGRAATRWRIRNVVVWARPNPPVGSLGDKFRPATSYLTVACKSDKRWFDLDAVRARGEPGPNDETVERLSNKRHGQDGTGMPTLDVRTRYANEGGAPPLDYWEIPTEPFPGSHYATFPRKLVIKPVESMCPKRVCRVCGEPSRRITEDNPELAEAKRLVGDKWKSGGMETGLKRPKGADRIDVSGHQITTGWTDCDCPRSADKHVASTGDITADKWRNGVVLDVFAGSGTTLSVATGHGRDAIGVDLDSRNAELALERVGPLFLTVETLADTEPFAPPPEDVETDAV